MFACLKFIAEQSEKRRKRPKLSKIPDWVYGKTNQTADYDIPEFWDKDKDEGMALFKIENGKLRIFNLLNTDTADVMKCLRAGYGPLDETGFAGKEAPEYQLLFALKTVVNIADPSAVCVLHENIVDDGEKFYRDHYVMPLYGCYSPGHQPWPQLKDNEDASICPVVRIPFDFEHPELGLPVFPDFSRHVHADKMAAEIEAGTWEEKRGILQCAYFTNDIKKIRDWNFEDKPDFEWVGTDGSQFWFCGALFKHMDLTEDYMPSPKLPGYIAGREHGTVAIHEIPQIGLGYKMEFGKALKEFDKELVRVKQVLTGDEWKAMSKVAFIKYERAGLSLETKGVAADQQTDNSRSLKYRPKGFEIARANDSASDQYWFKVLGSRETREANLIHGPIPELDNDAKIVWSIKVDHLRAIGKLSKPWLIALPGHMKLNKDYVAHGETCQVRQLWLRSKNLYVIIN